MHTRLLRWKWKEKIQVLDGDNPRYRAAKAKASIALQWAECAFYPYKKSNDWVAFVLECHDGEYRQYWQDSFQLESCFC